MNPIPGTTAFASTYGMACDCVNSKGSVGSPTGVPGNETHRSTAGLADIARKCPDIFEYPAPPILEGQPPIKPNGNTAGGQGGKATGRATGGTTPGKQDSINDVELIDRESGAGGGGGLPGSRPIGTLITPWLANPAYVPIPATASKNSAMLNKEHRKVIAKSYIAHIDTSPGTTALGDPPPFMGWNPFLSPRESLRQMANIVNSSMDEIAETPDVDWTGSGTNEPIPRLLSWAGVEITCYGNRVVNAKFEYPKGATGQEFAGLSSAPPGFVEFYNDRAFAQFVYLAWRFRGRPPPSADGIFGPCSIAPRTSVFIWHYPAVLWVCKDNKVKRCRSWLQGSKFPSHKAWDNGSLIGYLRQGPFGSLWNPLPGEPELVEESDTHALSLLER